MGALQLQPSRAGTVRRIIRRGVHFACGLCRSDYLVEGQAQSCVQRCWGDLLALDPVIRKRRFITTAYRCRFCARDYATHGDAEGCAKACRTQHVWRHEHEQSLTDQSTLPPPKRQKAKPTTPYLAMVRLAPPPRKGVAAKAKAKTAGEEASETGNPINADIDTMPPGVDPPGPAAAEAKPKAPRAKNSKAFYRDGARYVCSECHAKYFTKGEVEGCFAGHG